MRKIRRALACAALTVTAAATTAAPATAQATDGPQDPVLAIEDVAAVEAPTSEGYWLTGADGGVFAIGAPFLGSSADLPLVAPVVDVVAGPGGGYWQATADGGVFAYGAEFHGSMGGAVLNEPVVGMAADPDGDGYWLVAADGGVFGFEAPFHGSMGGSPMNEAIVGMAADPDGVGYWLVGADGGVFAFEAPFDGSLGGDDIPSPIVDVTALPGGYAMVDAEGSVTVVDRDDDAGSLAAADLTSPIVGIDADPDGAGYRLASSGGGVYAFDASFEGSVAGMRLRAPIVAVAGTATAVAPPDEPVDLSSVTVAVDDPAPATADQVTVTVTVTGPAGEPVDGAPVDVWVAVQAGGPAPTDPACVTAPDPGASLDGGGPSTGTDVCTIDAGDPVTGPDGTVVVTLTHDDTPVANAVVAWTGEVGQTFFERFSAGGTASFGVAPVLWSAPGPAVVGAYVVATTNLVFGDEVGEQLHLLFDGPIAVEPSAAVVVDEDTTTGGPSAGYRCDQDLGAPGPDLACTVGPQGSVLALTVLQPVTTFDISGLDAAVASVEGITGTAGRGPVTGFPHPVLIP